MRKAGSLLPAMALSPSAEPLNDVRMIVVPVIPGNCPWKTTWLAAIIALSVLPAPLWNTVKEVPIAPAEV